MPAYLTAAFYKFVNLPDAEQLKPPLLACCEHHGVKGLILLATEGINSTIAGPAEGVQAVLAYLRQDPRLADLQHKEAWSQRAPFYRMKVRIKKEIVTLGVPGVSPTHMAGTYVKPQDWNALIQQPDVLLLVDYPGFNLRFAKAVKEALPETKQVYYISPQVWAWNKKRIPKMVDLLDEMLCLFPFEKPIFN